MLEQVDQWRQQEQLDVTLPGRSAADSHLHPVSQIIREVVRIFAGMGFTVMDGKEIETDYYNFQSLNFAVDHPARDMQDTFWVVPGEILLRTQTTSQQAHIMERLRPPLRALIPGKVYRNEAVDASHEAVFHQIDGLLVDEHCTMGDLKGVLGRFVRELFGEKHPMRFRPSYFPFTEPSAELDIRCLNCHGAGCPVCKQSGWVEVLGSGMVHPRILRRVGYDPAKYRGFAFGMGAERVALPRYGIDDIRRFAANDLRFLRQFA